MSVELTGKNNTGQALGLKAGDYVLSVPVPIYDNGRALSGNSYTHPQAKGDVIVGRVKDPADRYDRVVYTVAAAGGINGGRKMPLPGSTDTAHDRYKRFYRLNARRNPVAWLLGKPINYHVAINEPWIHFNGAAAEPFGRALDVDVTEQRGRFRRESKFTVTAGQRALSLPVALAA